MDRQLIPGSIIYIYCPFTNPPKEKYIVVADLSDPPLLIVVNSSVHRFIAERPRLLASQVLLPQADYPFFRHDSHLDCSTIIDTMNFDEITAQLIADTSRIVGQLTSNSVAQARSSIQQAPTVSQVHAGRILAALK